MLKVLYLFKIAYHHGNTLRNCRYVMIKLNRLGHYCPYFNMNKSIWQARTTVILWTNANMTIVFNWRSEYSNVNKGIVKSIWLKPTESTILYMQFSINFLEQITIPRRDYTTYPMNFFKQGLIRWLRYLIKSLNPKVKNSTGEHKINTHYQHR